MIKGFACTNPKAPLSDYSYDAGSLGDDDVEIKITHCGICHSDIHLIDNDWGISQYPFIPGHEIIGTIAAKGKNVTLAIGARVGLGWQCNSCGTCEFCLAGMENHCQKNQPTCVRHHGGYAEAVRANQRFVIAIPDSLDSAQAAPLLCGGVTVFTPLHVHNVGTGAKVAVVGIGGLGHLALQFAHVRGSVVTAISTNLAKEAEARSFGAEHFLLSTDAAALQAAQGQFDFILVTASADVDVPMLINLLRPRGKLCVVGALPSPMQVSAGQLIHGDKCVVGSNIGSPAIIRAMLETAAKYKVAAKVETMPMQNVHAALDKVRAGQALYRIVLEH
jgi:uncharacterized zinc-type alcohol dehydrogenase-like protein